MSEFEYSSMLSNWYATPLKASEAQTLLLDLQQQRKQAILNGGSCELCEVREMIARFWLGKPVESSMELAIRTETNPAKAALLRLAYGQLLVSRKLQGAFEYLDRGLHQAAEFLMPVDYFKVMNRHDLLSVLPLFNEPRPAADLPALENEARILSRLTEGQPRLTGSTGNHHLDRGIR